MRSIQFITHQNDCIGYAEGAKMALEGGCKWIQLRMKDATDDEVRSVAAEIQPLCKQNEAIFLLDDRVELVRELHADGVHLGKNDMPVREARTLLGKGFIIGGTANTFDDIMAHCLGGADYIGCGPFRFTTTKQGLAPVLGLEGYRNITAQTRRAGISLPIVAIGGITANDIASLMATGIDGIALSSTVLRADNPVEEMKRLIRMIKTETGTALT